MFRTIVKLCEEHGFFKVVSNSRVKSESIKIGPTGALLQENLKNEWFNNLVINKDVSVFYNHADFKETFDYAKEICYKCVPFGIAESIPVPAKFYSYDEGKFDLLTKDTSKVDFDNFIQDDITLKCTVFVPPKESMQFFHQWQRQRKMWWRKFAASPGRYSLTDIRNSGTENNSSIVDIEAKFPWGKQTIERIKLSACPPVIVLKETPKLKYGQLNVLPLTIETEISLTNMFLNTVCDAYEEPLFLENKRPLLRFHRKLAPYKISFAISANKANLRNELEDLALYLTKQLRTNQVSTLFVPTSSKLTLDAQWRQYDQMGVPYNVLLNESTLTDGIAFLRSRDTTLKEEVHVTKLATYVEQLFKNY